MIVLILFFGLFLRLINLNQSLWLDEAVQAITAQKSFHYIFEEISGDFHPPLYHFLMHFWVRIFGSSEIALRMPSVIFGVVAVWLVYLLAREITGSKNKWFALTAAAFMATAPFHIYYSQEARMYSMATFLVVGSFYFFLRIIREGDKGNWGNRVGYLLFSLLAIYTDYFSLLALAGQMIFLLFKKRYKFVILNSTFFILFYLPWLPMLITQIKVGSLAIQNLPAWGKLVNLSFAKALPLTLIKFSIGRITIFNKTLYGLVGLGILGGLGVLGIRIIRGIREDNSGEWKVIGLWFGVPLVLAWVASLFVPNFQPFRLLLILPAFYMLLALGIESFKKDIYRFRIKSGMTKIILVLIVLLINISSVCVYYFNPFFQREDWRGLTFFLQKQEQAQVVLPSNYSNWPIKYYDPAGKIYLTYSGEKFTKDSIYFIRYLVPLFDPNDQILNELTRKGYTKSKEISFNQISVWEYLKK